MIDKLGDIKNRFADLGQLLIQPATTNDPKKFRELNKEDKDLEKIVGKLADYEKAAGAVKHAKEMLMTEKEEELRELAKQELAEQEPVKEKLENELKEMLMPRDPN